MEFTGELPDNEIESVVEGWVDSNLDSHIQSFLDNNDLGTAVDVEAEIVIKQNVDGITGEARDALVEMVATEVHRQVSVLIVNLQRGLRGVAIGETRAA